MKKLTHLSLFSGIGGADLAAEWAGFTTVGQCEWADYPTKVLEKHWPDVPRWRDIHDLSAVDFVRRTGIEPGQLDCISGGSPASRIRLQESVKRLLMNVICGRSIGESLMKLNQNGLWLKMYGGYCQAKMDGSFEVFSGTLPTWGMMLDGVVFELPTSEQYIAEKGLRLLPTVTTMDSSRLYKNPRKDSNPDTNHAISLTQLCYIHSHFKVHPEFIEAMMGLTIGWTDLNA